MRYKRIIPCLDLYQGRVVKGVHFKELKDAGDPIEIATLYTKELADELVLLDISSNYEKRNIMIDIINKMVKKVKIPLIIGGGLRTVKDVREILNAGAKKVSLNSAAVQTPELITELANEFGSQAIIVAIDAKKREDYSGWDVYINGGKRKTNLDVIQWAKEAEKKGAGEILLTSIDKDGTKTGYDISLIKQVVDNVNIPVIASGGAGTLEHFYEVFKTSNADAALAASLFHFKEIRIPDLKQYLETKKVPIIKSLES
ncbi:MAG: imidazole glycerol phosphate synthase subunit HisF [Epulopiscium sp.]|nr:imidazole glycerol phosphate synthase subunit HisF [Candidatus Epulonipiscium sp.]